MCTFKFFELDIGVRCNVLSSHPRLPVRPLGSVTQILHLTISDYFFNNLGQAYAYTYTFQCFELQNPIQVAPGLGMLFPGS